MGLDYILSLRQPTSSRWTAHPYLLVWLLGCGLPIYLYNLLTLRWSINSFYGESRNHIDNQFRFYLILVVCVLTDVFLCLRNRYKRHRKKIATSHYLCHKLCYHVCLVEIALGTSRILMVSFFFLVITQKTFWGVITQKKKKSARSSFWQ